MNWVWMILLHRPVISKLNHTVTQTTTHFFTDLIIYLIIFLSALLSRETIPRTRVADQVRAHLIYFYFVHCLNSTFIHSLFSLFRINFFLFCVTRFSGSLKLQLFRDELESHKNELTIAADSLITRRWCTDLKSIYSILWSILC